MKKTSFSVLMSVYYKENPKYLDLSLKSIFDNTIVPDEVLLVQDGKLSSELEFVITKYKSKYDSILKIVKFETNRGLGQALHDGLLQCSNNIVFRMDTDDICVPNRFEKQLAVILEKDVDVVGTNIQEYDNEMAVNTGKRIVPEFDCEIKQMAKKRNPINHMTVAYNKAKVIESGNYLDMLYFEDYYLWARMIKNGCKFYNIQEPLVNVRGGKDMIQRRGGLKYIKPILKFEKELLKLKIINLPQYCMNVFSRVIISIIPNNIRYFIYMKKLRD